MDLGTAVAGSDSVSGFAAGEAAWVDRFGNLRNSVRQELIRRQLAQHVAGDVSVLDVGCGQGTQAVELARRGCHVTGVDPSDDLLARLAETAQSVGVRVETLRGDIDDLSRIIGLRTFDVVCAHGLLMYLDDAEAAIARLTERVAEGGLLSITFRNGDALAFRPGMRRDWAATIEAFEGDTYVNELGLQARAHHIEAVLGRLKSLELSLVTWYGVRVFTDPASADEPPPIDQLDRLLEAEWMAGQRDPYRRLASQIHVIARRGSE